MSASKEPRLLWSSFDVYWRNLETTPPLHVVAPLRQPVNASRGGVYAGAPAQVQLPERLRSCAARQLCHAARRQGGAAPQVQRRQTGAVLRQGGAQIVAAADTAAGSQAKVG